MTTSPKHCHKKYCCMCAHGPAACLATCHDTIRPHISDLAGPAQVYHALSNRSQNLALCTPRGPTQLAAQAHGRQWSIQTTFCSWLAVLSQQAAHAIQYTRQSNCDSRTVPGRATGGAAIPGLVEVVHLYNARVRQCRLHELACLQTWSQQHKPKVIL